MNYQRLSKILQGTTQVYRKGEEVKRRSIGNVGVTEIFGYSHTNEAIQDDNYDKVDMVFVDVLVDKAKAAKIKPELERILAEYPQPDRLEEGPSYIELSPNLGLEQEGGLRIMALGKTLGLWEIISGKALGMDETETLNLAEKGFLMISGYGGRK